MEKLSKNILFQIFTKVGPIPLVFQLCLVCKKWNSCIRELQHYFTFQGIRHPKYIPSNLNITPILEKFKSNIRLQVLDLRNINIETDALSEVLLCHRTLKILDLTNTQFSLGQVWSYMQTKKGNDTYYLEELRFSNNSTVYLGYDALVSVFPNLIKLYAGNTKTMLENFKLVLERLPKLQVLDVSLCNIDYYDMAYIDFRNILENSDLQRIFISEINETVVDTFLSFNIEIIENTIGDVLKALNDESALAGLDEWLKMGGDVNLRCNPTHKLFNEVGAYPQLDMIKRLEDEYLLREAFRIQIAYDLDLSLQINFDGSTLNILNTAIMNKRTGLVHLLISAHCDISPCFFSDQEPSMTLAARLGDQSIIQIFLDYELYNIDFYSPKFCNPVCIAAQTGNKEMFLFLIEQGVPLFPCSSHPNLLISNKDILTLALSEDHKQTLMFPQEMLYEAAQYYLIKRNVEQAMLIINSLDPQIKDNELGLLSNKLSGSLKISADMHKSLLILATEKNLGQVIKKLVELGFDINGEDMHGWTPFMAACSYGYVELIPYFCDNGAIVNKRDKWWRTALHQAAQNGHVSVVRELIRYGAALSPECDKGLTPLNYAIYNLRLESVELLRQHGARMTRKRKLCLIF